jgi:hypothetical protein
MAEGVVYGIALAITAAAWLLRWFYDGPPWREVKACYEQGGHLMRGHLAVVHSTPDSERYLAMGRGERQCYPFHARWLVPWLCGDRTRWWHAVTAGSLIASGPALCGYALALGLTPVQALACVVAFTGLWGCFGLLTLCPILVDAPGLLIGLASAGAYLSLPMPWSLAALLVGAILAGAVKETAPVWLALMAWHPAPLIGLLVPAYRRWGIAHPPPDHDIVAHPLKSAMQYRRGTLFDGTVMIYPWGLGLLALLNPSPQLWLALAFAYAQPLIASDVQRLVHVAAPIVLVHAIPVVPEAWLPLVLVLHMFNPWAVTAFERQPVRLHMAATRE